MYFVRKILIIAITLLFVAASISSCTFNYNYDGSSNATQNDTENNDTGNTEEGEQDMTEREVTMITEIEVREFNKRSIYLAGGCFWGVEGYFQRVYGIYNTEVGYANGTTETTDYYSIDSTDHAETVKIDYDMSRISLEEILLHYFRIIDPTSINKQGNDIGRQYRTGIYYVDEIDIQIIEKVLSYEAEKYGELAVEFEELKNFIPAEDYHQDYLERTPGGYCHINLALAYEPLFNDEYVTPSETEISNLLDKESYDIMMNQATEAPHSSELNDEYRKGIYVDKITGEPLFSSSDKFDSGCGWPSFAKPISSSKIVEVEDNSFGMVRTEVRTSGSDAHLGHVFDDGPQESGSLRYCINGKALEFIPYEEMEERGYSDYMVFCD